MVSSTKQYYRPGPSPRGLTEVVVLVSGASKAAVLLPAGRASSGATRAAAVPSARLVSSGPGKGVMIAQSTYFELQWVPTCQLVGCCQGARSVNPGLKRAHSESPVTVRGLTPGPTPSRHRREILHSMVPHGPAAIILFLISLILSCGHLIESFDAVIFIGVLYQLFWLNCVFFTRGNFVEESSVIRWQ